MQQESEGQQTREVYGTPGSDPFDAGDDGAGGLVTVLHAPYSEQLPVGELTVRQVRDGFQDRLEIHPQATAYVDGSPVDEDTVVHEGQRLMFMRPAGEKGGAA